MTERQRAAATATPAMILILRETPARRTSSTCPTSRTAQATPITAKLTSQTGLGGSGANEGKSGILALSHASSHTFSTVIRHNPAVKSQVRLSVRDFRRGG